MLWEPVSITAQALLIYRLQLRQLLCAAAVALPVPLADLGSEHSRAI